MADSLRSHSLFSEGFRETPGSGIGTVRGSAAFLQHPCLADANSLCLSTDLKYSLGKWDQPLAPVTSSYLGIRA